MDRLLVGVSGSVAVLNVPSYLAALRAGLAGEITGDHDLPGGRIRAAGRSRSATACLWIKNPLRRRDRDT
jgi:hypothetical protein